MILSVLRKNKKKSAFPIKEKRLKNWTNIAWKERDKTGKENTIGWVIQFQSLSSIFLSRIEIQEVGLIILFAIICQVGKLQVCEFIVHFDE